MAFQNLASAVATAQDSEPRLQRQDNRTEYPLSLNQRQVWFECQLDPQSTLYNLGMRITISGPLDEQVFLQSFIAIVDRHEILRTVFTVEDDLPVQRISRNLAVHCPVRELPSLLAADYEEESWARIIGLGRRPFDLSAGPLFRAELLRASDTLHYFVFAFHHLILDEFYCGQMMQEIVSTYFQLLQGKPASSPPQFQYGDFSTWVQERWSRGCFSQSAQFWQAQLREPLPHLALPPDRVVPLPWRISSQVTCRLNAELVTRLRELGRQHRTTLFRSVLAGLAAFFSRFSETQELMFDIDFSVRPREMSHAIGFFANSLPVRLQVDATETFESLLEAVDLQLRQASANRDFPVRQLARKLRMRRDPIRPLSSVIVTQVGPLDWSIGELQLSGDAFVTATVHDLWLGVMERGDIVDLNIAYPDEVFDREKVERWAAGMEKLLQALAAEPNLPLLHLSGWFEAEQSSILGLCNVSQTEFLSELEEPS